MGPPVIAWAHGHTHYNARINVHGTTVFANQKGYPGENCGRSFDPSVVFSVSPNGLLQSVTMSTVRAIDGFDAR